MNTVLWVLQAVVAFAALGSGMMKLTKTKAQLLENPQMGALGDFTQSQIKGIGGAEVAGGIGLILPWLLDILPVLTPIAAVGLAILLGGGVIAHVRRGEYTGAIPAGVLCIMAIVIAIGRFGGL